MSIPRKILCKVASITDHGGRVYTVELRPDFPLPPFRPGQFLHLTVEDYDPSGFWPESRVFSIASSPNERNLILICYSVVGRYTAKMEQVLKVGGVVWVKMPYGDFIIDEAADVVLITGGTGIGAFSAFLETISPVSERRITLLYGARNPALYLFEPLIKSREATIPNFKVFWFAESDAQPPVKTGRIDLSQLPSDRSCMFGNTLSCPTYYISGPPAMLKKVSADLITKGVSPENIKTDAWE